MGFKPLDSLLYNIGVIRRCIRETEVMEHLFFSFITDIRMKVVEAYTGQASFL
jgi:hypothetical protein